MRLKISDLRFQIGLLIGAAGRGWKVVYDIGSTAP
jgi:hypothetical protein